MSTIVQSDVTGDLSKDFPSVAMTICSSDGRGLRDFLIHLRPRYYLVWTHIFLGYAALVVLLSLAILAGAVSWPVQVLAVAVLSILMGIAFQYLSLFIHEAAHWNLAQSRKANDRLANMVLGMVFGQDVRKYRPIHWDHHRHLGTDLDPERSYFNALTFGFLIRGAFGVTLVRTVISRIFVFEASQNEDKGESLSYFNFVTCLSAGFHSVLVVSLLIAGKYSAALAWTFGFLLVFPLLGSLRQLLEHRPENLPLSSHGTAPPVMTRTFSGPISQVFGGAGFDRHLVHHWLPTVSYTRLREVEEFLISTSVAPILASRRNQYWTVFRRLLGGTGK